MDEINLERFLTRQCLAPRATTMLSPEGAVQESPARKCREGRFVTESRRDGTLPEDKFRVVVHARPLQQRHKFILERTLSMMIRLVFDVMSDGLAI